jgi:hypothetical protein
VKLLLPKIAVAMNCAAFIMYAWLSAESAGFLSFLPMVYRRELRVTPGAEGLIALVLLLMAGVVLQFAGLLIERASIRESAE